MVYQALQKMLTGAAVLSFAVICPIAAATNVSVLSDLENGTNENAFGQYWYVYDDSKDGGNTVVSNMTKKADGTYDFLPTAGAGNTGTGGTPGFGAKLAFQLGTTKPGNATASWGNMVGMGTMLAADGDYMDLTGAQKIDFWAKVERPAGTAATVDLRVEVCTQELETDFGFYHIIIPITGTWAKYTIPLSSTDAGFGRLEQWDWSVSGGGAKPFNIKKISKIQWCLSEDGNTTSWADAAGVLSLDDITISPFTPHFFDEIEASALGAAGAAGLAATNKLCDFNTNLKNSLGQYAYCYTDADANPTKADASTISAGATLNDVTGKYVLTASDGGVTDSKCASITFQLGKTFLDGTSTVQPFVGIGTNLTAFGSDGATPTGDPFDIKPGTAIYFDYKLACPGVSFMTFELSTSQSFGNKGAGYYVKVPASTEWKSAKVDLSAAAAELVLPKWTDVTPAPLDISKALKFQWKVQGTPRAEGTLAIDNVYIVGKTFDIKVIRTGLRATEAAFQIKQVNNMAQVSFALPQSASNARVELVSMQGKVLASELVKRTASSKYQVAFPTSRLANGSYFVKVNYDNKDARSTMISIIK